MSPSDVMPDVGEVSWLLTAFQDVATCRSIGMSYGPIPITAMWEWCDRNPAPQWTVRALRQIDGVWLALMREREKGQADGD